MGVIRRIVVDEYVVDMPDLDIRVGEEQDLVINGRTVYGITLRHLINNVKPEDKEVMQAFTRYFINAAIKVNKEGTVLLGNRRLDLKVKADKVKPELLEEILKETVLQWLATGRRRGIWEDGQRIGVKDLKEMKNNKGKKKRSQR